MDERSLDGVLSEALRQHRNGALEDAEAGYVSVLEAQPAHVDALYLLAALRLQQGRAADALGLSDNLIRTAPNIADAHANRGTALQVLGRYGDAAFAFRAAIDLAPDTAHLHFNLGNALRASGDKVGAAGAYRDAVALNDDFAEAHSNLAATLSELGLFAAAAEHCHAALRARPSFADAHYNLGNALREAGRFEEAAKAYADAIGCAPGHANALCNLGLTQIRDGDLESAALTLGKALEHAADHTLAAFYRAVVTEMTGAEAAPLFDALPADDPTVAAWLDSWAYVKSNSTPETAIVHDTFALLSHALRNAEPRDGLVLEFGVRHGASLGHIAGEVDGPVHGFDSFHGLPAAWGGEPAGVYSTAGALPEVPENVTLYAGLFEDTLGPFLDAHPGPVRFCNIDCDIYSSTVTVLDGLATRIRPGSVLVFDEYLINPTWREDEFRAFQDVAQVQGWRYRYLAFGIITKQAAVLIEAV